MKKMNYKIVYVFTVQPASDGLKNINYIINHNEFLIYSLLFASLGLVYKTILYSSNPPLSEKDIQMILFVNKEDIISTNSDCNKKEKYRNILIWNPLLSNKKFIIFCKKFDLSYKQGLIVFLLSKKYILENIIPKFFIPIQTILYLNLLGVVFYGIPKKILYSSIPYCFTFFIYLSLIIGTTFVYLKTLKFINNLIFPVKENQLLQTLLIPNRTTIDNYKAINLRLSKLLEKLKSTGLFQ